MVCVWLWIMYLYTLLSKLCCTGNPLIHKAKYQCTTLACVMNHHSSIMVMNDSAYPPSLPREGHCECMGHYAVQEVSGKNAVCNCYYDSQLPSLNAS